MHSTSTLRRPSLHGGQALSREVGLLAGRLADLVEGLPSVQREMSGGVVFLRSLEEVARDAPPGPVPGLDRLVDRLDLSERERDLVLLAGMPEEHEGLASVLSALHPAGRSWSTPGLAAQLLAADEKERSALMRELVEGPAVRSGLLVLEGDGPVFTRSLKLGEALWPAMHGHDAWPTGLAPTDRDVVVSGLEPWLKGADAGAARAALSSGEPVTVVLTGQPATAAFDAAAALVQSTGLLWAMVELDESASPEHVRLLALHAIVRDVVPVLALADAGADATVPWAALDGVPAPVLLVGALGGRGFSGRRTLHLVRAPGPGETDRVRMWRTLLPELDGQAEVAASCYRLSPGLAADVASDVRHRASLAGRVPVLRDIGDSLRGRTSIAFEAGVQLVHPGVAWERLILPPERKCQLEEAAHRLLGQVQVLDRWGFLYGRAGARGVRLLLSGPPGTGKTLAAEALASRLGVDLLVVDLSRVVSKWIGETEKHLAGIFETAERTQAVLLFDEADALFGKRTEVSDAHDRYANLETAYLLARLERFEGLVALSTNLKRNIDPAFMRRMEFVVELDTPEVDEREAIWKAHVPEEAPLSPEVDFRELASLYPMVGGLIRNAAVAAAFLAAQDGKVITRRYLVHAIRREYAKAGLAFPGAPSGLTEQ